MQAEPSERVALQAELSPEFSEKLVLQVELPGAVVVQVEDLMDLVDKAMMTMELMWA